MFRGRYEHHVDGKGRTSLPSRFRDVLMAGDERRFILTSSLDPCLVVYPMDGWRMFEERLASLPQFDPGVTQLRRVYVSGAVECELDKVGRLVIPSALRVHADLRGDAVWAGMGRTIELWAKHRFEEVRDRVLLDEEERKKLSERLAELGL